MKLSKRTRYGFRLMTELARNFERGPVSIKEIAERQNLSVKYLEQIIMLLKNVGPVTAVRGPRGGYMLSIPPSKITLKSLFDIFEGPSGIVECVQDPAECKRANCCASRKLWVTLDNKISEILSSSTLEDLIDGDPADFVRLKSGLCVSAKSTNRNSKRTDGR
jgi:Rrf2 family cysteine metabolism transcriptional repressor